MCKDRHGSLSVWRVMGCGMRVRELCVVCMYGCMHGRGLGYYVSVFSLATPHSIQKPVTKGFLPPASSNQFWSSSAP